MDSDSELKSLDGFSDAESTHSAHSFPSQDTPTPTVLIQLANRPKPGDTCVCGRDQYICVDHAPNNKNGSRISPLWDHGTEQRLLADLERDRYWRCGQCRHPHLFRTTTSTGPSLRYLKILLFLI